MDPIAQAVGNAKSSVEGVILNAEDATVIPPRPEGIAKLREAISEAVGYGGPDADLDSHETVGALLRAALAVQELIDAATFHDEAFFENLYATRVVLIGAAKRVCEVMEW